MNKKQEKVVYQVSDIQELMGNMCRSKVYQLADGQRFPVKKIGNRIYIPKKGFDEWLNNGNMFNMYDL